MAQNRNTAADQDREVTMIGSGVLGAGLRRGCRRCCGGTCSKPNNRCNKPENDQKSKTPVEDGRKVN